MLVACTGQGGPKPADGSPTAETGDRTTEPVPETETGATGQTGDTASWAVPARIPSVRLFPEGEGDWAGRELDLADLDGDGLAEVLVSSDWSHNSASGSVKLFPEESALYLLRAPLASGALRDQAAAWWDGTGSAQYFSQHPLILPSVGQVVAGGFYLEINPSLTLYDVPPLPAGALSSLDHVAYVDEHLLVEYGTPTTTARCETPGGPALCVTGNNVVDLIDFSGHLLVYPLPVEGAHPLLDTYSWLKGDIGDHARIVTGDHDLDGDGRADVVVGAYGWSEYTGRLAVLHELPAGEHRLWDVVDATLTGEEPGEELGLGLATGDVDGDGYVDILAGSPLGDGGAFAFFGPFSGDRTTSQAEVVVSGGDPGQWLGYALAAGDLTADGGADLAVGAPWSAYLADAPPGRVFVFDDPRGALDIADAAWTITSGVAAPDAFGIALEAGDLDGDGTSDLVVGAPRDPTAGYDAGSVSVLLGIELEL
jgi:hypothetical protein